jgi:adenine-specific DNA-methyltransferase
MMYPRLFLARQLLRDDGVIFVSIDDHEVHNLSLLMNEVFGEENFVENFVWKKSYGGGAKEKYAVTQHEYVLLFARSREQLEELWLPPSAEAEQRYYKYRDHRFAERGPYRIKPLEASKSMDRRENLVFSIPHPDGGEVLPKRQWW